MIGVICIKSLLNRIARLIRFFIFITVILMLLFFMKDSFIRKVMIQDIDPGKLEMYFRVQEEYDIPWCYFAIIEREGHKKYEDWESIKRDAEVLAELDDRDQGLERLEIDITIKALEKRKTEYEHINSVLLNKEFPIKSNIEYSYLNGWHAPRSYGGERKHEGIDIMCDKGTPIISVSDGRIIHKGWNTLGGWRIGIVSDEGIYYYYAHMYEYEEGIEQGDRVATGQVIGYVGDSGYGPEGTVGKFASHLHFGMYEKNTAVSPYPFLLVWEDKQ